MTRKKEKSSHGKPDDKPLGDVASENLGQQKEIERPLTIGCPYERDLRFIRHEGDITYVEIGLVPNMKVPGRVFIGEHYRKQLLEEIRHYHETKHTSFLPSLYQIANAAALPGIVGYSTGLPDIHCGYGFAIGHMAAFDLDDETAVVSPGGVGFDINCGVRLLRSSLKLDELREKKDALADAIFARIPVGVGGHNTVELEVSELRDLMRRGMAWAVERNLAWPEDVERCERQGHLEVPPGNFKLLNQRAEARGAPQLGTLGSGNHYIEVQAVSEIYDETAAQAMGIASIGQICVMIHCGSRGFGHQIAADAINAMKPAMHRDNIKLNDSMLACARIHSPEGQQYLAQMAAAANFAFVNRSVIAHRVREAFGVVFNRNPRTDLDMHLVYDVAHNIAQPETHTIDGQERRLLVLRKGSTRAFPPGHPDLPRAYQNIGQPVLVGGSMGTCSYVLTGTEDAMQATFGSTCHGAGRVHGRNEMKRQLGSEEVLAALRAQDITVRVANPRNIVEEAPESYKDVTKVVDICHRNGISKKAFKLVPVCVIKG